MREIELDFSGGKPGSTLHYTILLSKAAAETGIIGEQDQHVYSGHPNGTISDTCAGEESALAEQTLSGISVSQFLYGSVNLDSQGDGIIYSSGKLKNQRAYATEGDNDVVNVINIVSIPATSSSVKSGKECALTFPGWGDLAGSAWYPPHSLIGDVKVGAVGSSYTVQSANPALTDLANLSWQVNGPTAINYTLTNQSLVQSQSSSLFWAGVLAALATALAVDGIKGIVEKITDTSSERGNGIVQNHGGFITILAVTGGVAALASLVRWIIRSLENS